MIPRPLRLFLAAETVFVLGYFLLPPSGSKAASYLAMGLTATAALVVGTRIYTPRRPVAWYLLAAGTLMLTVGDTINNGYEWVLHREAPFPSVADAIYVAFFALLVAGLLQLARARTPGRDSNSLIDAIIIGTGVGLLSWVFLIVPYVRAPDLTSLQRVISIIYPVQDIVLLVVALRLWRVGVQRSAAFLLLTGALVALLVGDTLYGLSQLTADFAPGGVLDLGWVIFFVALGASALHPSMRSLSEQLPAPTPTLSWQRRVLLTGATLMAPAMLVIQTVRGQPIDVAVNAAGTVVLFVLLTARMTGLAGQAARQQERERALAKVLEAAQKERIRLAADLHDGPVQELTALNYGLERVDRRLQTQGPDEARKLLGEQKEHLTMVTRTLRSLLSELRPPALDEHGLAGALELYGQAFAKQAGIKVSVDVQVEERPAPEVETIIYRITQEALTNVAKHAQASHVWIRLAAEELGIGLTVRDDGIGFDAIQAGRLLEDGHYGLVGMRERAEMGGGRLDLDSRPDHGTTIHVTLPMQYVPSFA